MRCLVPILFLEHKDYVAHEKSYQPMLFKLIIDKKKHLGYELSIFDLLQS